MATKIKLSKEGFIYDKQEEVYHLIKDNKIVLQAIYINYAQGLNIEWVIKKLHEKVNFQHEYHTVFQGKIPNQKFLGELIESLL